MWNETSKTGNHTLDTMLARCRKLGLLACSLGPDGALLDVSGPNSLWDEVLRAPSFVKSLQRTALLESPKRLRGSLAPTIISPGVSVVLCPHADDTGLRGSTAVILIEPEAVRSDLILRACCEAGLDNHDAMLLVNATGNFGQAASHLIAQTISTMSQDVAASQSAATEVEGFTKQLTGAFETIDVLYNLGRSMKAVLSPEEFLQNLCTRTAMSLNFAWVAVRFEPTPKTPTVLRDMLVHHGMLPTDTDTFRAVAGRAMDDIDTTCKIHTDLPELASTLNPQTISQPLLCKGHQIGVMLAGGKGGEDWMISSYDTQLFEACAGFLSTFIDNVALYDDQHQLFMGTVQAMTAAIDAKDRYTRGHSERVAQISMQLAHAAGLPPQQCERIRIAGLVHDVGKIGVPENVLLKAGKLTEDEFAHIKKHPQTGYDILKGVVLLEDVLPGVMHHHERYDGKGYPHGLFADEIPLIARIIAVADTFDAMSSNRAYRSKMPRDVVLAEIARSGGTQLDPRISQLMLSLDLTEYDAMTQRHAALDQQTAEERATAKAA
jgi:HD-GYP domain-containing protein (c-di-GMP phosphodiesterase class II)